MAEPPQPQGDQIQFLLSDFNTRLRDIDERNRLIRERVLLLGKNLIESRGSLENELQKIKKENAEVKRNLEKIKIISKNLAAETGRFVKREEMMLVERMLKDFQPLEFMRKKDIEKLIEEKIKIPGKQIKTTKTKK